MTFLKFSILFKIIRGRIRYFFLDPVQSQKTFPQVIFTKFKSHAAVLQSWIQISGSLLKKWLDPDPQKMNVDPQPCCCFQLYSIVEGLLILEATLLIFWSRIKKIRPRLRPAPTKSHSSDNSGVIADWRQSIRSFSDFYRRVTSRQT